MEPSLRERALRLLARREHSRAELARKLAGHATTEEIESLANQLEQSGLLSDARFVESFVAARAARLGGLKLRHELRSRGVADDLIASHVADDEESELGRAREVWLRKFGHGPADAREYARQARFLAGRGFAGSVVHRLLKNPPEDAS